MTSERVESLGGQTRAAILLLSLGERLAAEVLKHMSPKEVHKLGLAMAALNKVSQQQVMSTLDELFDQVSSRTPLGVGTENYLRNVLSGALGNDKGNALVNRIMAGENSRGIEALKWMDAPAIARLIRNEHPQIMALVLAHLESELGAEVLNLLPEDLRPDLVTRIAMLDSVPPSALNELDAIFDQQVAQTPDIQTARIGGIKTAANILTLLDAPAEAAVLEKIKEADPQLGETLDESLFAFENLVTVSDRSIQALLREITNDQLIVALKGCDQALREKFFSNMSRRAAELLRDDLEGTGPVRVSQVEEAQKQIVAAARRMAEAGEIALGKGDDYV